MIILEYFTLCEALTMHVTWWRWVVLTARGA